MRMKRVSLCGFKQFDVGRKMALCLRFGGVDNTNGDIGDKCKELHNDSEHKSNKDDFLMANCDCQKSKGSIFKTIRRKWRRHKRKRCDNRKRVDPILSVCHSQDELHGNCIKHQRLKCQNDCKTTVSPIPSSNYVGNNDSNTDLTSTNARLQKTLLSANKSEDCLCCASQSSQSNVTDKLTKLKVHASRSMSDISSAAPIILSSPVLKTDSESDIGQVSTIVNSTSQNNISCANEFCLESPQTASFTLAQESLDNLQPLQKFGNLTQELYKLSKYGWYWGPISRSEAESKLVDQPDGAFLVRDSSDDRYILSLSFRSYGKTLHTRIEHSNGLFSFYSQPEPEGHASIVELIKQSMYYSQSGVFCYSRSRSPGSPSFPVRLTKPISRFTQVRSLQYLSRFVIRQYTRFDHIQKLPLPPRIKGYLEEGHY